MYRLTPEQIAKYESKLKVIASPTLSSGTPRPILYELIKKKADIACIIGLLDMFGIKKYFDVSGQEDIDQLIKSCQNGYSMDVKWYYLTHQDVDEKDLAQFEISSF